MLVRVVVLIGAALLLGGCAAGRTAGGGVVVGWEVGQPLPDDVGQAIIGGATTLGTFFGGPAGAGLAGALATGAVGIFGAKRHADAKAEAARRAGERAGWDEAVLAGSVRPAGPAHGGGGAGGTTT